MQYEIIDGEQVVCLSEMPEAWQNALNSGALDHVPHITIIDQRFRAWYMQMVADGEKSAVCARETVEFYAVDWQLESYPDFNELLLLIGPMDDAEDRVAIINAAKILFEEFGHWLPASFYHVLIAPALRGDVRETRMLRYSEPDAQHARGWDASLHAFGKAFDLHLFIQAVSSRHGFVVSHGCDCNHKTNDLSEGIVSFDFPSPEQRWLQVMACIWHMWWDYAMFNRQPNTRVGSSYVPESVAA